MISKHKKGCVSQLARPVLLVFKRFLKFGQEIKNAKTLPNKKNRRITKYDLQTYIFQRLRKIQDN